jgi:TRAP-type C4-dicarboxylate transport system permease small subunit
VAVSGDTQPPSRPAPRAALDGLYHLSGGLAGVFLVAICAIVAAQVVGNVIDRLLIVTHGAPIGIIIPAYSDFAGFFLAASTFLALAHTLMRGEHVRVRLVLNRLPAAGQYWAELWCAGFAGVVAAAATYFGALLTWESWRFGDAITGMVAVPLWIPQLAMVTGLMILTIAIADIFCSVLTRGRLPFEAAHTDADSATDTAPPPRLDV